MLNERLAHCNVIIIKCIFKEKLVIPDIDLKGDITKCESCVVGKNIRSTYPRLKTIKSTDILMHGDQSSIWKGTDIDIPHLLG